MRGRDQLRAQPHFTPPWAPSWAQSAAPTAPAPSWVQPAWLEGAQRHPRVGWDEHQDTQVPFQPQCNQSLACLGFPSPQKDGSPPPHSSKVMLPFLRRVRPAAGRMQPSGEPHPTAAWAHPTGKEGPGEGASPPPPARPAAERPLPVRWQQGTAVPPPCHRRAGTARRQRPRPGMLAGDARVRPPQPSAPGGRSRIPPAGTGATSSAGTQVFLLPENEFSSPFCPKDPLWQGGRVLPPGKPAGYISGCAVLLPCCLWGHLLTHKVLHPLPSVTHLPQSPLIKHPSPWRGTRVTASAAEARVALAASSLLYTSSQLGPVPRPITSGIAFPSCLCGHLRPPGPPERGTLPAAESPMTTT